MSHRFISDALKYNQFSWALSGFNHSTVAVDELPWQVIRAASIFNLYYSISSATLIPHN